MTKVLSDKTRMGWIEVLLVEENEKAVYCSLQPTATATAYSYSLQPTAYSLQLQVRATTVAHG